MTDSVSGKPPKATRLLLGLGNPGERYRDTRHNLGFCVVDAVARSRGLDFKRLECNALVAESSDLVLAKPQTFMNRSGYAARCLAERRDFLPTHMLVIYDDVQLPLGRLRLRLSGGPGGHRGMESVIRNLQTDEIPRLRLGISDPQQPEETDDLVDYVLSPFRAEERQVVEEMIGRAARACVSWWVEGPEVTMSEFNG